MGLEVIALAALAGTVASTGISMYGQHQQAKTTAAAANYNNQLAGAEADNLANEAREAQTRERQRNRRQMAQLRLSLGQQGTLLTSGTPQDILAESQQNLSLNIADAARRADMQTRSLRGQGAMGIWEAGQFKSASRIGMASTAISGITKTASSYRDFKYTGAIR